MLASCSEFLVVEPDKQVSITEQFSSKEGVLQAVNGMYFDFEAMITWKEFIYADLMGGNITFSPAKNDYLLDIPAGRDLEKVYEFRDQEQDSDYESVYKYFYDVINASNTIMEQILDSNVLSEEEIRQITAEALAIRAYTHFMVAQFYAQNYSYTSDASHPGIIYNQRTLIAGVDYPSRKSMKESYRLMKDDFLQALDLFGDTQALPYGAKDSYFNPVTTAAVFAKCALQMNDWESAWLFADSVIQNSGVSLMTKESYIAEWEKPEEAISEMIFELSAPRESDGAVSSSVAHEFYVFVDSSNYKEFVASGDLLEMYDSTDIRKDMFLKVLLPTSVNDVISYEPYYFTKKFQDDPGTIISRLSEMYLIRAEAGARMGGAYNVQAMADLNSIRERAGLAALTGNENLLEEIFLERRRELAFEGFLFFDLMRYHKDVVRNSGCLSTVCNLAYPSDYFVLPIPESSITLNENMDQNEGY